MAKQDLILLALNSSPALEAMEQVFDSALDTLRALRFDRDNVTIERGRSALTPRVQSAFHGFLDRLLADVVRFNGASCALSNFAFETLRPF